MKYLPKKISSLLFLTIPFSAFGFYIGPLLFSICFIPVILINLLSLQNGLLKKSLSIKFLIFFSICFISSFGRYPISSFLPSLLVFSFLLFPFLTKIKIINTQRLMINSFALLSIYCLFEFIIGLISVQLMFDIENFLNIKGSTTTYRGIRRLRGAFLEPSVMGIALNFYLLYFSNLIRISFSKKMILIFVAILLIILTFSSSAYAALTLNIIFIIISKLKINNIKLNFKKIIFLSVFALVLVFGNNYFFAPIYKAFEKLTLIPDVILSGNITGSVGYRINSLIVAPIYIQEAGFYGRMLGTGFSNYSDYIITNYGQNEFSGFYDGSIGNIFSAILLSTGLLGFFSFLVFMKEAIYIQNKLTHMNFIFLVIMALISFGDLTSPWIWIIIYTTKISLENIYKYEN
ncbi:hypothetical protein N9737_03805 [Polaribacter sp.]|nr:hypothetical protein [Polaribacter sp.]